MKKVIFLLSILMFFFKTSATANYEKKIYDLNIENGKDGKAITIKMTLTAPGCGMGPVIADEVERKISGLEDVSSVSVELVWEPMWTRDMMSEAAQLELGMI